MGIKVLVEATLLPITVAQAKEQCEYLDSDRDAYFEELILAAANFVERELEISIMERTLQVTYDEFSDEMELPFGPVTSVVDVDYFDEAGGAQTLDPANYTADLTPRSSWIIRNSASTYPATMSGANAIRITYVAGLTELPPSWATLKHAIRLMVAHFFANRESVTSGQVAEVPLGLKALIHTWRSYPV